ncbi:MAG: 4-hydroxy-3-methylbut-2-enyl diphosphate reductase [Croceibacterium sp.]
MAGAAHGTRKPDVEVLMAAPRGFCAGVRRAIGAVRDALAVHGAPVYVRHAIVHNYSVVRMLEGEGAVFVEQVDEVPAGGVIILSAHGVVPAVARDARRRGLTVYDAVCPLVAKVHREVERHHRSGRHVVIVGHRGHPEIDGTLGRLPPSAASLVRSAHEVAALRLGPGDPIAYAVQTTFSVGEAAEVVAALERRFHDLVAPPASDICYATTNRQAAVSNLAAHADAVIVVGERISSNANRLVEVAAGLCSNVQLVATADALDWSVLPAGGGSFAITAAASTPESSVDAILVELAARYTVHVSEWGSVEETQRFKPVAVPSRRRLDA